MGQSGSTAVGDKTYVVHSAESVPQAATLKRALDKIVRKSGSRSALVGEVRTWPGSMQVSRVGLVAQARGRKGRRGVAVEASVYVALLPIAWGRRGMFKSWLTLYAD